MLLQRALDEERDGTLIAVEMCIRIDTACLHQMLDDERRVGYAHPAILDEGQLALWSLAGIGRVDDFVGKSGDAQPRLELAAERAEVGDPEEPRELEELDGWRGSGGHGPAPVAASSANAARRRPQSPSVSKMRRISSRRAPKRSSLRCSSSTRVTAPPWSMKRISISVFKSGSYCQSAVMSQDSTSRNGGSQERTLPHWHVLPSSPRSYQRPPTCGSMIASTALALPILSTASGHHVPILSVKT